MFWRSYGHSKVKDGEYLFLKKSLQNKIIISLLNCLCIFKNISILRLTKVNYWWYILCWKNMYTYNSSLFVWFRSFYFSHYFLAIELQIKNNNLFWSFDNFLVLGKTLEIEEAAMIWIKLPLQVIVFGVGTCYKDHQAIGHWSCDTAWLKDSSGLDRSRERVNIWEEAERMPWSIRWPWGIMESINFMMKQTVDKMRVKTLYERNENMQNVRGRSVLEESKTK